MCAKGKAGVDTWEGVLRGGCHLANLRILKLEEGGKKGPEGPGAKTLKKSQKLRLRAAGSRFVAWGSRKKE